MSAEVSDSHPVGGDAVVSAFLAFLAKEMKREPQTIKPLDRKLIQRVEGLGKGASVPPRVPGASISKKPPQ